MTDANRTNTNESATDREPEMLSGTTGVGSDLDASMGGLSGSIASGTPSGPASDTGTIDNDPTAVSGGPDLSGTMGGTGGMDVDTDTAPTLDSDPMALEGSSGDEGRDVAPGYGSNTGDPCGSDYTR